MRRSWWVGALALLAGGSARADFQETYKPIEEHHLVVVDQAPRQEAKLDEFKPQKQEWAFPKLHLTQGGTFADPFAGTELYPELSAGTQLFADQVGGSKAFELRNDVDLNLYLLEVRFPLYNRVNDVTQTGRIAVDFKIPFAIPGYESNRFALVWGHGIDPTGTSGFSTTRYELIYGYGGEAFGLQLRGSYRVDDVSGGLATGFGYGAIVSYRAGPFMPMVEAEGIRRAVLNTNSLTIFPGVRFFPGKFDYMQLGVAAIVGLQGEPNLHSGRVGGVVDVSYNFL